jgi:hypothetical protein
MSFSNDLITNSALKPNQPVETASPGICNRISQKGYAALKNIGSFGAGILKGAITYGGFQAVTGQILTGTPYNLKVFSAAVLNPSEFRSNPYQLKEIFDKIKFTLAPGLTREAINKMTNSNAILNADCPYQEYLNQANLLSGENNTPESIARINFLQFIVIPAVAEELIFRGLLQDVILKRLVGKVVQKIAPSHAGLVDSKIYTAIRIALTTYAFMSIHEANRAIMPDSYVDMQLISTIVMGIGFGILKEAKGLSWSIGAHAINNLSASLPGMMMKC